MSDDVLDEQGIVESDWVGDVLQVVGWVAAGAGVALAILIAASGSEAFGLRAGAAAATVAVVGIVQGMILVGFGRLVSYMRGVRDLLAVAIDQTGE